MNSGQDFEGMIISYLNKDEDGYIDGGEEVVITGSFESGWERFGDRVGDKDRCSTSGGTSLKGYFLPLGSGGTHQGISSFGIRGIPLEQVKLKNY